MLKSFVQAYSEKIGKRNVIRNVNWRQSPEVFPSSHLLTPAVNTYQTVIFLRLTAHPNFFTANFRKTFRGLFL